MESDLRYEILDTIASGEFATVGRARDRDLGREVAVKQIHDQYLADPRQLARYWQEAYNGVVMRMALLALVLGKME